MNAYYTFDVVGLIRLKWFTLNGFDISQIAQLRCIITGAGDKHDVLGTADDQSIRRRNIPLIASDRLNTGNSLARNLSGNW